MRADQTTCLRCYGEGQTQTAGNPYPLECDRCGGTGRVPARITAEESIRRVKARTLIIVPDPECGPDCAWCAAHPTEAHPGVESLDEQRRRNV